MHSSNPSTFNPTRILIHIKIFREMDQCRIIKTETMITKECDINWLLDDIIDIFNKLLQ